jgi:hypothetical protein
MFFLAARVSLQGWNMYRGDLDVKTNTKGTHAHFTSWNGHEFMFHVSPLIPRHERLPLVGNDIVNIIFQESEEFIPSSIDSKVNHAQIIVQPSISKSGSVSYRVAMSKKIGVPNFTPALENGDVFERGTLFREWLLTACVNAERAALHCKSKMNKNGESFLDKLYVSRAYQIHDLVSHANLIEVTKKKKQKHEKADDKAKKSANASGSAMLDRKPWPARVAGIWAKSVDELNLAAELPRLTAHLSVSGVQRTKQFSDANSMLSTLIELSSRLEEPDYLHRLVENFHIYLADYEPVAHGAAPLLNFITDILGLESRTVSVLKACSAAVYAPALEEITEKTIQVAKMPYKDMGFWEVEVLVEPRDVRVFHRRRQQALNAALKFSFEFELMLRLSSECKSIRDFQLYVTDLNFGGASSLEEDKMREAFKPFISPALQQRNVFGKQLSESDFLISESIELLEKLGASESEGILRKNPPKAAVLAIRNKLDAGAVASLKDLTEGLDPHVIAGVLRLYLRELPEPILTFNLYDELMRVDSDEMAEEFLEKLPPVNRKHAGTLLKFFADIASNNSVNLMNASNVAKVMQPNLIWARDRDNAAKIMADNSALTNAVELLIVHFME